MDKSKQDYSDIISLPHHRSARHAPMSAYDRAAQFSPFAALKGYDEEIREASRVTQERAEMDDARAEALDRTLRRLHGREADAPFVRIRCFVPDALKEGGAYSTICGRLLHIDAEGQCIWLQDGTRIPFSRLEELEEPEE